MIVNIVMHNKTKKKYFRRIIKNENYVKWTEKLLYKVAIIILM